MSRLHRIAACLIAAPLAACGSLHAPSCPSGQQAAVQELLYFGTDKPSGRVTSEDWARFLGEAVTPKFPDGLTAWRADGQWRSTAGTVVREPSYVLSLVHPDSAVADHAIHALVAEYKTRFQQEAVLRVQSNVCISL